MSGSVVLFPFAFQASTELARGKPTNPVIKSFLSQFPPSPHFDVNSPTRTTLEFNLDEFGALESRLLGEQSVSRISESLDSDRDTFTASLYETLTDYPARRSIPRPKRSPALLEFEQTTQRKAVEERYERRRQYLEKRVKADELHETAQEHDAFVRKIGRSRYADAVEPPAPSPAELAAKRWKDREQYGEAVTESHKTLLPRHPKPRAPDEKDEKLPPVAADLYDWGKRMDAEHRELAALRNAIEVGSRAPAGASDLIARLEDDEPEAADAPPPDYHMQFAMLFQKLENAEQKLREVEERCGRFQ